MFPRERGVVSRFGRGNSVGNEDECDGDSKHDDLLSDTFSDEDYSSDNDDSEDEE